MEGSAGLVKAFGEVQSRLINYTRVVLVMESFFQWRGEGISRGIGTVSSAAEARRHCPWQLFEKNAAPTAWV